jgi:hypothetical protein
VHGPVADVALGWCWLPVTVLAWGLRHDVHATQTLMVIAFAVSFAHQPLTLGLVYGDRNQYDAHPGIYRWTPLVAVAVIVVGWNVSFTAVAVVAALWNAEHTLMQRYGVTRIYGRKNGDTHGSIEKPAMIAMLIAGIASIGAFADREAMINRLGLGRTNATGVRTLDRFEGVSTLIFWAASVVALVLCVIWAARERRTGGSWPKTVYALGTVGLVAAVVYDPVAGFAGYVAAHAIEYFAVVHSTLRTRSDSQPVARATATRQRRIVIYCLYFAAVAALVIGARRITNGYAAAILFFGALHVFYDGFVWKLRKPNVAASLGLAAAADARAVVGAA